MTVVSIGIYVHAEPERLRATLAAVEAHTPPGFDLLLLPDGPDLTIQAALAGLAHIPQSATDTPLGAAACFNRLAQATKAETVILLESGTIVAPGWLEKLLSAMDADPRHGLASPSTNQAWNQLAAFRHGRADAADVAGRAAEADARFGQSWRSLAPLWDVGDFCLAVRRAVIDAVGPADEGYGLGPCWEMDYAVRVVRAGFVAVWAQGAYVFRHPFTARREREEARLFETSRRRYQDRFCGLRLSGARQDYHAHCSGEVCRHFAPAERLASPKRSQPSPAIAAGKPLVSCIMPTNGRPEWMMQAIRYFQRQDYPNRELVIIDGSLNNLVGLVPPDPRIRHFHVPSAGSIGAMRNLACERARGDIIMHWDDDDWYSAARISAQAQQILKGLADVNALDGTCFFELDSWAFWRCTPEHHGRLFVRNVHGGTLAYRRTLFQGGCRYPEISIAEDAEFLQRVIRAGGRLAPLSGEGLFIYLRHGRNAWAFPCGHYLGASGWQRIAEPTCLVPDRSFYLARSPKAPDAIAPLPVATEIAGKPSVAIGVHVHAEPERLLTTLAALRAHSPPGYGLLLLPDGPDARTQAVLADLRDIPQSGTDEPRGAAACLNRLARSSASETIVLLESGTVVGPGWLEALVAALHADPRHGLATPSTNLSWNQLAAFPQGQADEADIARTAAAAMQRYGRGARSLAPLWDVGDFCLAATREAINAIGPADEGYGLGPCWEMDYAARAARSGFIAVWAQGAYVYRHPFTERRQREEARRMEANRHRYQDAFCGLRLSGARQGYNAHCRGEACRNFAAGALSPVPKARVAAPAIGESQPLISCIMPTYNRRRFVTHAIAYFQRQSHRNKELIVLDDGQDSVADLIPSDPAIRYRHLPDRIRLGAKLNLACEMARGDILAHFDDDDWYAPWRLAYQIDALRSEKTDLCGINQLLYYDLREGRGYEYRYPENERTWLAGSDLVYTKSFWASRRFADVDVGMDGIFCWSAERERITALANRDFAVHMIHAANGSPKQVHGSYWRPHPVEHVAEVMGDDWAFYEGQICSALPRGRSVDIFEREDDSRQGANSSLLGASA